MSWYPGTSTWVRGHVGESSRVDGPPPASTAREGKEVQRSVDAHPPGQGEGGAGDREAASGHGDVVHPSPIDRFAARGGVADDHRQVGDPDHAHEAVVGLAGVRGQHDEFFGRGESVGRRAGAVDAPAPAPEFFGIERGDALGHPLQPVVQLQEESRHVGVGQRRVVEIRPGRPCHPPAGVAQGLEGPSMVGSGEQQVDVLHRAQTGFGIARRHRRALQDDGLQAGAGQRPDGERDRAREQEQRFHPVGVGGATKGGPERAELLERIGRGQCAPEQGADAVLGRGRDGQAEVGTAVEGTPDGDRIGLAAAGLPKEE